MADAGGTAAADAHGETLRLRAALAVAEMTANTATSDLLTAQREAVALKSTITALQQRVDTADAIASQSAPDFTDATQTSPPHPTTPHSSRTVYFPCVYKDSHTNTDTFINIRPRLKST